MIKRINKILWHGNDIPLPSAYEGSLSGLNRGELYIYENDEDPAIFIKTNKNKVKRIGGGGGGTTDINEILDLIDQKLNGYATEEWVSSTYATKTALSTLSSSVNSLRTDFDNLNALLNDDVTGKINTWYEVVDFLDEYSGSQDLAAILSGMNTDIASRVEKSKFAEYFSTEMAKWFVKDDTNRGIKPVNSYGLYSDTYVSAKGVSTGTGGSGGGSSYNRLDRWSDYTSDKAGWVLSALLGQDLNSRVASLESGSALSVTTSGSGNAVTGVSKSGNQLVITKGATFQSLITSSNKLAYSLISGTPTSLPASDVAAWAKAASKPSYAFSEITNKPTTLSGYGITDAYTATTIDGKLSGYLPLSGGRMTGTIIVDEYTSFGKIDGSFYLGNPLYPLKIRSAGTTTINDNTLIHSGNIGSQSVNYATSAGNADNFGGLSYANYLRRVELAAGFDIDTIYDMGVYRGTCTNSPSGNAYLTALISLPYRTASGNATTDYGAQIAIPNGDDSTNPNDMFFRTSLDSTWNNWQKVITDGNIGSHNAGSATKLQTPRSIWGQSFDGTGNVSGNINLATGKLYWHGASDSYYIACPTTSAGAYLEYAGYEGHRFRAANGEAMRIAPDGNVLIGTSTEEGGVKLLVDGVIKTYHPIFSYAYKNNTNGAAYMFDKPGSYFTGIGSSGVADTIRIGACTINGVWVDYTQNWQFYGNVIATGSVTAKSSSSDIRLKKELTEYSALEIIKSQRSVMYKWNDIAKANSEVFKTDAWQYGLIAQELQATHPQLVSDVFGDYLTINYERLIPIVWRGVQEVNDEVTRLKAEVKELKNRISIMEGGRYGC